MARCCSAATPISPRLLIRWKTSPTRPARAIRSPAASSAMSLPVTTSSVATLKKAVVYGSVMASYNVEDFSLNRLRTLTQADIASRYRAFQEIAHFEAMDEAGV